MRFPAVGTTVTMVSEPLEPCGNHGMDSEHVFPTFGTLLPEPCAIWNWYPSSGRTWLIEFCVNKWELEPGHFTTPSLARIFKGEFPQCSVEPTPPEDPQRVLGTQPTKGSPTSLIAFVFNRMATKVATGTSLAP